MDFIAYAHTKRSKGKMLCALTMMECASMTTCQSIGMRELNKVKAMKELRELFGMRGCSYVKFMEDVRGNIIMSIVPHVGCDVSLHKCSWERDNTSRKIDPILVLRIMFRSHGGRSWVDRL